MKNLLILLLITTATFSQFGCTKYEDGPAISLRSKQNRVGHSIGKYWKSDGYILKMGQEGFGLTAGEGLVDIGDWYFNNSKEKIIFESSWQEEDYGIYEFRILKLKHKKLKIEGAFPFGDGVQIYEFEMEKTIDEIK